MRTLKLLTMVGMVLAVAGIAGAVSVPLPSGGTMKIDAWGAFSEVFLDVAEDNVLGLPAGTYNDIGIGYNPAANAGAGGFVLYTGALSSTAAAPTAPGSVITLPVGVTISDVFKGNDTGTRGRLYVGGSIQSIGSGADTVFYARDAASAGTQLTFTLYNAYVDDIVLTPVGGITGFIQTKIVLSPPANGGPDEQLHFDIWADNTPDATLGNTVAPVGGTRYVGVPGAGVPPNSVINELPVRDTDGTLLVDLNDGTYHDRPGGIVWPELAFAGDPTDDDQVFWSFVGNPDSLFQVEENFSLSGESFVDAGSGDTIYISGPSNLAAPQIVGLGLVGQLLAGPSLVSTAKLNGLGENVVNADGTGVGNGYLDGNPYLLRAAFEFGGNVTGAYDSDPNTFSFQQGDPGAVATLTQLTGGLVPEPMTMLGVFMGISSLGAYIRRTARNRR